MILFDSDNQALFKDEERIQLSPKTFGVLEYLHQHQHQLVTKDELLSAVWPNVFVSDAVLKVAVGELRKILGDSPKKPSYIETVHRRGYRFIGTLELVVADAVHAESLVKSDKTNVFIGRSEPLAQLQQAWELVQKGHPQVLFIRAEAGMGKTALLSFWINNHLVGDTGYLFSSVLCFDQHGKSEPYLPILNILGEFLHGQHKELVHSLLRQYAPNWMIQIPSSLQAGEYEILQKETFGATAGRMQREFVDFAEALSHELLLLICIEDLHWCDAATIDLLMALAHRQSMGHFMLVGSFRSSEVLNVNHPLKAVYSELMLHRQCLSIELENLNRGGGALMVAIKLARVVNGGCLC